MSVLLPVCVLLVPSSDTKHGAVVANLEGLTSTHVSCVTHVTTPFGAAKALGKGVLSVNPTRLGKEPGQFPESALRARVTCKLESTSDGNPPAVRCQHRMANPPAIRWRARRRQPPRPNARPRLDLFHSRTGPPHSCGGSLLLPPPYLLTRLRRQSPAFTVFPALRTGLDQSGSVGPFGRGPGAPPAGRPAVEVGGRVSSPRQEAPRAGPGAAPGVWHPPGHAGGARRDRQEDACP